MAARITEVRDAAAAKLTAAIGGEAAVVSGYTYDPTDFKLTGRTVFVVTPDYGNQGPATRSEDIRDSTVVVLVAERYTLAGDPTEPWVDDLVAWTEEKIVDVLDDSAREELLLGRLWPESSDVIVYDPDMLREHKIFWSEVEVTFRELRG